jgi:hypothetical protein
LQFLEQKQVERIKQKLPGDGIREIRVGLFNEQNIDVFAFAAQESHGIFCSVATFEFGCVLIIAAGLSKKVKRDIVSAMSVSRFRSRKVRRGADPK